MSNFANVVNGKLEHTASETTKKSTPGTSSLGKDEFLQLLVTQMKYQDPLNPSSDTQFVEQLATFSQLEQMQNLNSTTVNSQAFTLVGKEVIVNVKDASGNITNRQGVVDYVTLSGNKTYLSIENTLYSIDDLETVIDQNYIIQEKLPAVEKLATEFNLSKPEDIKVKLSLGEEEYEASSVAVVMNGEVISADSLSYDDGVLTIKKEALSKFDAGNYGVGFVFNDPLSTTITDKVIIKITGIKSAVEDAEIA